MPNSPNSQPFLKTWIQAKWTCILVGLQLPGPDFSGSSLEEASTVQGGHNIPLCFPHYQLPPVLTLAALSLFVGWPHSFMHLIYPCKYWSFPTPRPLLGVWSLSELLLWAKHCGRDRELSVKTTHSPPSWQGTCSCPAWAVLSSP
jgi:hypothetical protein